MSEIKCSTIKAISISESNNLECQYHFKNSSYIIKIIKIRNFTSHFNLLLNERTIETHKKRAESILPNEYKKLKLTLTDIIINDNKIYQAENE